jgi:hypothetical protein
MRASDCIRPSISTNSLNTPDCLLLAPARGRSESDEQCSLGHHDPLCG